LHQGAFYCASAKTNHAKAVSHSPVFRAQGGAGRVILCWSNFAFIPAEAAIQTGGDAQRKGLMTAGG
jgi:hypothetical protein